MLFSISVSFTNKNVNHIVIFELKKLFIHRTSSRWQTPQNQVLTDTDTDEEFNIDEAVPANRGPCVSLVYPEMFDLPESRLQEETDDALLSMSVKNDKNVVLAFYR
jgi:hypothetical protein